MAYRVMLCMHFSLTALCKIKEERSEKNDGVNDFSKKEY